MEYFYLKKTEIFSYPIFLGTRCRRSSSVTVTDWELPPCSAKKRMEV